MQTLQERIARLVYVSLMDQLKFPKDKPHWNDLEEEHREFCRNVAKVSIEELTITERRICTSCKGEKEVTGWSDHEYRTNCHTCQGSGSVYVAPVPANEEDIFNKG